MKKLIIFMIILKTEIVFSVEKKNNSENFKILNIFDLVSPSKILPQSHQDQNQGKKSTFDPKRFFNFDYFPFSRPVHLIPECADEAKCISSAHCHAVGGTVKGKCYKGFAVCCALEAKCGSVVKANETYLVNDGYPNSVTTLGNCQYNIIKIRRDICQLRFDMFELTLLGPDIDSQCSQDTFSVSGGTGATPFVICGRNSGQHMYVDMPEGSTSARVNIATASNGYERQWKIKVSQISCYSRYKAPPNCLQYFTDYSGIMNSFNYQDVDGVHQIANQMYTACIESKPGFCGINFKSYDFSVTSDGASTIQTTGGGRPLYGDNDCQRDFISIFTASKERTVQPDRYCGNRFENVTTFSKPFEVRVLTDYNEDNDQNNRGFSLHYVQIPC
ncbi:UNVERIFIED_CONTAM: hypothetical protein RMT77_013911 [Armadillidium vulgare]